MENKDKAAFPLTKEMCETSGVIRWHNSLTKREYFAGLAMQGLLSNGNFKNNGSELTMSEQVTISAIIYADELLKQLEK